MGTLPYPGNGLTGIYPNGPRAQPTNAAYTKIQSIIDLVSSDSLEFEYSTDLNADLHVSKCQNCVQFGLHTIMPGNCDKLLRATKAHSDAGIQSIRRMKELSAVTGHDNMQT